MYQFEDDTFVIQRIFNNHEELPAIDMSAKGFNILPNYELRWIDISKKEKFKDIMKDENVGNDEISLNVKELHHYIIPSTLIRVRESGLGPNNFYIKIPLVNCKEEWFKHLKKPTKHIDIRLCPNIDEINKLNPKFWELKGAYDDDIRTSMATIIETCQGHGCKSQDLIKELLESIFLSEYIL